MVWTIEIANKAEKELSKLDKNVQKQIIHYLETKILTAEHPRVFGKSLTHELSGYWRYRVGDYRIMCHINDEKVTIMVVRIGHRSKVYK
ncbi:MAG: type II toxin-antitoxin system mRNA interferase toxin, RelE/StbE family [Alphaproteobacteria bacterium]|nr:type II toxin-antitoxin system mRNA interferase toxin, RelE/StbE family [Alphaproteobacteria bacterium]|tara:strand:+ start:2772 stop:3038 length:267 start_codon:yes stop_codon:yes gene_type:complete